MEIADKLVYNIYINENYILIKANLSKGKDAKSWV